MTQGEAVLYLLRSGPKTTSDFINSSFCLAAEYRRAISDLRRKGYRITATMLKRGRWEYRIESEPPKIEPSGQMALI